MNLPYVKVFGDLSATVDLLSDAEAGRLLKSLLHYINGGEDELLGQEKLVFAMLKSQIDRDSASYAAFTDKQRENGKKGGRPPKANAFSDNPKNPGLFSETQKSHEEEKEKDKDKDKDKEKDKDVTGAKAPSRARDGRFDVFWANYPRKVGKEAARKAFSRLSMTNELLSQMLSAIKQQCASPQWTKDNGQYIPNPATWLNQGRWEDVLPDAPVQHSDDDLYFNSL